MKGKQIRCDHCDGQGVVQGKFFDPWPKECRWCAGNGTQWLYPGGAIAVCYGGPLVGHLRKDEQQ